MTIARRQGRSGLRLRELIQHLLNLSTSRGVGCRHHKACVRSKLQNRFTSLEEQRSAPFHFGLTRARQHSKQRTRHIQIQTFTSGILIGFHRNDASQGVTDVRRLNPRLIHQFFFKRKDHQHMIDRFLNRMDAFRTPCPNGRTNEMNGFGTLLTKLQFDPQIKVRCVHADESSRSGFRHIGNHALTEHQQLR